MRKARSGSSARIADSARTRSGHCSVSSSRRHAAADKLPLVTSPRRSSPQAFLLDRVEELEDPRPHHRHHAAMVAVYLEVFEGKAALAHVTRQHAAALERWGRAGALSHENRQPPD